MGMVARAKTETELELLLSVLKVTSVRSRPLVAAVREHLLPKDTRFLAPILGVLEREEFREVLSAVLAMPGVNDEEVVRGCVRGTTEPGEMLAVLHTLPVARGVRSLQLCLGSDEFRDVFTFEVLDEVLTEGVRDEGRPLPALLLHTYLLAIQLVGAGHNDFFLALLEEMMARPTGVWDDAAVRAGVCLASMQLRPGSLAGVAALGEPQFHSWCDEPAVRDAGGVASLREWAAAEGGLERASLWVAKVLQ